MKIIVNNVNFLIKRKYVVKYYKSDFTLSGYYNSTDTSLIVNYGYKSIPLINVIEGQTIYFYGWYDLTIESVKGIQFLAAYNNDNLPYNGTTARVNGMNMKLIDSNNKHNYYFTVPSNCSQIGISCNFDKRFNMTESPYIEIV